jgi:8-amino-7-oxononanoate synthase
MEPNFSPSGINKPNATSSMRERLQSRADIGNTRNLQYHNNLYDFSSNDYLGFSRSVELKERIMLELEKYPKSLLGATGSRLLSGNTEYAEELEKELAGIHQAEHGLIFDSGYSANLALFSCLPQKDDVILCDEYIHASVIDGARLSFATRKHFKHNNLEDLESQLKKSKGVCYVAVESVYSMDGDLADLIEIARLCRDYQANLIVDEAHAFGVFGTGIVDLLELQPYVFARIVTFGKALGLHGAIVLGSELLRTYLINFARPFIFSTAPPFTQLLAIKIAYERLLSSPQASVTLQQKSSLLKANLPPQEQLLSTHNPSAIQCIFLEGNEQVVQFSQALVQRGFDVRAIRSPSVPKGKERLRICMHTHNTDEEILQLCAHLDHLSKNFSTQSGR